MRPMRATLFQARYAEKVCFPHKHSIVQSNMFIGIARMAVGGGNVNLCEPAMLQCLRPCPRHSEAYKVNGHAIHNTKQLCYPKTNHIRRSWPKRFPQVAPIYTNSLPPDGVRPSLSKSDNLLLPFSRAAAMNDRHLTNSTIMLWDAVLAVYVHILKQSYQRLSLISLCS